MDAHEPEARYLSRLCGEALALCFRAAPGYEARLLPQASLVLSGEPFADLNYSIIDDGPRQVLEAEEFVGVAQSRQIPLIVLLTPRVADRLAHCMPALGLQRGGDVPLMTCRPSAVFAPSAAYEVRRVRSPDALRSANELMAAAFDLPFEAENRVFGPALLDSPGLHVFIAYRDGEPCSAVITTRQGKRVGIWSMATAPGLQRQGAGRALLENVVNHYLVREARCFYLVSTEAGKRLYERLGFKGMERWAVWTSGASSQVGVERHENVAP